MQTLLDGTDPNYYFCFYITLHRKSLWQRFLRKNKRWKIRVRQVVKHQAFYWTVLICVFLNTVITALQHYNQPKWLTKFQGNCIYLKFDVHLTKELIANFKLLCFCGYE